MNVMHRNNVTVSGKGVTHALMQTTRRCPATSAPSETIGIIRHFPAV